MPSGTAWVECPRCRTGAPLGARYCNSCGMFLAAPSTSRSCVTTARQSAPDVQTAVVRHSTMTALFWSVFGLGWGGAIYNRQYAKAMLMLGLSAAVALATMGLSLVVTWPAGILDAVITSAKLESGETVGEWTPFGEIASAIGVILLVVLYIVLRLDRTQHVGGYWRNGRWVSGYWRRPPN